MRFSAVLATIVAFFSFALAQSSSSSSGSSSSVPAVTTTVTMTLYHANSTTTMTWAPRPTGGAMNYTSATLYSTPTSPATPSPPCSNCVVSTGAASVQSVNVALIPFAGVAALAFSLL